MKFELTEEQLKNLFAFLSRSEMKGSEVPAFNDILETLNNSMQEEE